MTEHITLHTTDGVTIIGDLYRPTTPPRGGALLLHMMPATKESWREFAQTLSAQGLLVLAIDLRGHGESTHLGNLTLDYRTFSDAEHQASQLDVEAALAWLTTEQQLSLNHIGIAGASLGANLALEALASHHELAWGVLLSPGLDYHGLVAEPLIVKITPLQRLLLAASDDDGYSNQTIDRLSQIAPVPVTLKKLSGAGHGTLMFERQPKFQEEVVNWITTNNVLR